MEYAFGTSLAHVRVHGGAESARLNADLSAKAFTSGSDIFVGGAGVDLSEPAGERVLAHEIAHVLDPADRSTGAAPARRTPGNDGSPSTTATKERPASAQNVPTGIKVKGQPAEARPITAISLWKTIGVTTHKLHWWIMFGYDTPEGTSWFQLDFIVADGTRLIWGATNSKDNSEQFDLQVPDGLTSDAVIRAAEGVAAGHSYYYNPVAVPQPDDFPRYSCQHFIRELAGRINLALP